MAVFLERGTLASAVQMRVTLNPAYTRARVHSPTPFLKPHLGHGLYTALRTIDPKHTIVKLEVYTHLPGRRQYEAVALKIAILPVVTYGFAIA